MPDDGPPLLAGMPSSRRVRIALLAGLGAIALLWLVGRLGPTRFVPTVLASYAPPAAFLVPLTAIVVASALSRMLRLASVGIVAVAGFAYAEGARISLGPSRSLVPAEAALPPARLRAMTYNVAKWEGGAAAIARAIASADPDVVCLEEAGLYSWRTRPDQNPEALARALPAYRFVGDGEVRIASRLPLREGREAPLPVGPPSRPLVLAVVDVGGRDVGVAAVHFIPTLLFEADRPGPLPHLGDLADARMQQAEHVLAVLDAVPGAVVLCGDLNAPPTAAPVRRIASRMRDAWVERGNGFGLTDPTRLPSGRIDYVFVRDLRVDDVAVGCRDCDASDHLPVVATLTGSSAGR
jgi:endonuclease/exonuclease/phosphatase (EEP) superfamily protein YafD